MLRVVELSSPNHDPRTGGPIDILVMHYTGMRTAEEALVRLCDPDAKVSAHYTVDCDGTVYAHVPEKLRAWQAGVSSWGGATDINSRFSRVSKLTGVVFDALFSTVLMISVLPV